MRKLFILAALTLSLILACSPALAQTSSAQQRREERQEQHQERLRERVELVITRFDNNKERHIAVYNALKQRLAETAEKLESLGYDLTEIRADYQTLDSKIVKFAQDYAAFVDQLRAVEQYEQGTPEFRNAIESARSKLRTVKDDSLDIRHYWQTVVRPDLKELRKQEPKAPESSAPVSSSTGK
ncbi:MAG: hypothetical protein PHP64_01580 [Actinomycetota bacterium]|nr:hypothetical protein [Actinomycetota bacterium]